ncbi:MAG: 1-acyl-sn-glycerol-3-phosphate acyltransferase [Candidatus Omnitrophica bacterium]|nr:1-acyl-sn-glycerol-3-phosphate acyltransferase [Candidatus Omnitrophota bacterium]
MLYLFLKPIAILLFKFLFHIKVFGKENIPKRGGFILASNHISYLDPVTLGVACPRRLNFMAKEELFQNPWFSWFISRLGAFPVKRNSADLSALKEAIRRLRQSEVLTIFPEGSRRIDGTSTEPQAGIGFLVAKLALPVVPAFIKGTDIALPKGAKFIRFHQIYVYFGKQILFERGLPYKDIAQRIMQDIGQLSC